MKLRLPFLLAVVFFALGLVIWFLCDTEQAVTPTSSTLSDAEKSAPTSSQLISTSPRRSSVPLANKSSFVVAALPDNQEQSKKTVPFAAATKGDLPVVSVDPAIIERAKEERVPVVDIQGRAILFALKLYREQIGAFPTGDSRSVSLALAGDNDRRIVFIEGHGWTNKQGELLDPWGMPYVFSFETNSVTVKSSGPNKMSGDTDDVVRVKSH